MTMGFIQDSNGFDLILNPALCGMLAGHLAFGKEKLIPVGRIHYVAHWLYGKYEPLILRLVDRVLRRPFVTGTAIGRSLMTLLATLSHLLPHGIVVPTSSAVHLVRHLETLPGDRHSPRLAVGPCVCQMSLDRWQEPSCKDFV